MRLTKHGIHSPQCATDCRELFQQLTESDISAGYFATSTEIHSALVRYRNGFSSVNENDNRMLSRCSILLTNSGCAVCVEKAPSRAAVRGRCMANCPFSAIMSTSWKPF